MSRHPLANTILDRNRTGKINMRKRAFVYAKNMVMDSPKSEFKMLTLPSSAWEFEERFLKYMAEKYKDRTVVLHACEYDWIIYAGMFPDDKVHIRAPLSGDTHWRIRETIHNHPVIVHNVDVFTYLEHTHETFDYIWLDLMSPVDVGCKRVIHACNRLFEGGILILSFIRGREKTKIADRVKYISDALPDMYVVEEISYYDTSPMLNVIFRKKLTLEGLEKTIYLGP